MLKYVTAFPEAEANFISQHRFDLSLQQIKIHVPFCRHFRPSWCMMLPESHSSKHLCLILRYFNHGELYLFIFSFNIARFLGCVDFKVWLIDEEKLGHKKSLICILVRVSHSNSYWRSSLANNQQENFSKYTAAGVQLMSIRCPMEMGGGGEGHRY